MAQSKTSQSQNQTASDAQPFENKTERKAKMDDRFVAWDWALLWFAGKIIS